MEGSTPKKGLIFLILAYLFIIAGIVSFLPNKSIDDVSLLGYTALCPLTPISGIIMILIGVAFIIIRKKVNKI